MRLRIFVVLFFIFLTNTSVKGDGKTDILQNKPASSSSISEDEVETAIQGYFSNKPVQNLDAQKIEEIFLFEISENSLDKKLKQSSQKEVVAFANVGSQHGDESYYIAQKGDSIWSIGKKYAISSEWIINNNPKLKGRPLYAGERVLVREDSTSEMKSSPKRQSYRVKRGDTLSEIARKYSITLNQIKEWNKIDGDQIKIGEKLVVSNSSADNFKIVKEKLFIEPVVGRVTSGFGPRLNPFTKQSGSFHSGIDYGVPLGTEFHAAGDGVVILSGRFGGYGNCIFIRHKSNYVTVYAHNKMVRVKKGDIVKQGDVIGEVGRTGNATGPHLHFEVRKRTAVINPKRAFAMIKIYRVADNRKNIESGS